MTKFLTLMNPRSRRYRRRTSRRRIRRNPSRKLYGAAAAAHARKAGRKTRSAPARRSPRRAARRRNAPPRMTPAMRAKVSAGVRRYFAAKRAGRSSSSVSRRVSYSSPARRRSFRSGGFSAGSLVGAFKGALSKPLLMKAGGAVLGTFGSGYIMNKFGASLPMATNQYGRIAYMVGIPIVGAYFLRNKNRDLAEGMVIGGLVIGVNALIQMFRPGGVAAYSAAPMRPYGLSGELGYGYYPGRSSGLGVPLTQSPFAQSAW